MLILASTSDIIRVVTGSAANIAPNASYVDNASGSITPGRTDTAAITTATTTTVVGSPGSSTQRTVETMTLRNTSNSTATTIVVQHYDGSASTDLTPTMTLQPGESLTLDDHGRWKHMLTAGAQLLADRTPARHPLSSTWLAETYPRELMAETSSAITSGFGSAMSIYLKAGTLVTNILLHTATTAGASITHWQFGLYSPNGSIVGATADQGSAAMSANTLLSVALAAPYLVPRSGIYYIAFTVTATTVPSLKSFAASTSPLKNAANATNTAIAATNFFTADAAGLLPPSFSFTAAAQVIFWAAVS